MRANWLTIVGHAFPGGVITDRSAVTGAPIDGLLWLAHPARQRELTLPGLNVVARSGRGPLTDDIELPGGLHLASRPRALLENTAPSRSRGNRPRRTLHSDELDAWIDRLAHIDGDDRLRNYRDQTEPEIAARFKDQPNRAGNTTFVEPELVRGTLIEGWHRHDDPELLIKSLRYLHDYTARIPWDDIVRTLGLDEEDVANETAALLQLHRMGIHRSCSSHNAHHRVSVSSPRGHEGRDVTVTRGVIRRVRRPVQHARHACLDG